ncbi:hypothetical protein [Microvirga sp. VF16]|uniref:hypothetical protein n=1 Tax=Microvirga sp. VF16 TaxID=2807101 RepID=UPI00193DB814|nr:hypothetical protein [Microvirga sp. VF16]QRM28258.1 hypothetical protein JO965_18730 [Microvirga sp. VF16]
MLGDHDPANACSANLSYAIASARAVVMALIARDRDAAEEAALRTCRDCDLLIRLIRDLAAVLTTNDLNQLTCTQAELVWLARRAEYVLTFVGVPTQKDPSPRVPCAQRDTDRTPVFRQQAPAASALTVAATGLRVRLIPIDGGEAAASSHGDRDHDQHGLEVDANPKPLKR